MHRVFHLFDWSDAKGDHVFGLVENGVPKAMATIPFHLFPPHSTEEALLFSIAVVNAFGQTYPVTPDRENVPWID